MDAPSMVERNGNRLLVRSLVSGDAVFQSDTGTASLEETTLLASTNKIYNEYDNNNNNNEDMQSIGNGAVPETVMRELQSIKTQPFRLPAASSSSDTTSSLRMEREEDLPQCKIRRNYSCSSCSFFTQNPRSHLSHLRDVHGERIVINECKLCLYASRHFQKLVRHMKMVHGCSDDNNGGMGGRRHCNREARKRRLEESIEHHRVAVTPVAPFPLNQLKAELELREQLLESYNRQQLTHLMLSKSENLFSMAFELQLLMLSNPGLLVKEEKPAEVEPEQNSSDSEELPPRAALDLSTGSQKSEQAFKCTQCSYETSIRARFKKHVKYHTMPLIKCSFCDFQSPYKWNLDRHTKNHGANGLYNCGYCNFSTNIKQSLTIHAMNHHETVNMASQDHIAVGQSEPAYCLPVATSKTFSCQHCRRVMTNALELSNHLLLCEPEASVGTENFESPTEDAHASGDAGYYGVETAPGYGDVTETLLSEEAQSLKKVFKCPHCTFWAATASRFHVHIVGHLNRKPFECSLCSYRSNWRWDITKHIRLKTMRDASHQDAKVLMNDETGRRNYSKYNQYLSFMKVNTGQAADSKSIRCGDVQQSSNAYQSEDNAYNSTEQSYNSAEKTYNSAEKTYNSAEKTYNSPDQNFNFDQLMLPTAPIAREEPLDVTQDSMALDLSIPNKKKAKINF